MSQSSVGPPGHSCAKRDKHRGKVPKRNPMTTPLAGLWQKSPDYPWLLVRVSSRTLHLSPCESCDRRSPPSKQAEAKARDVGSVSSCHLPGWESKPVSKVPSIPTIAKITLANLSKRRQDRFKVRAESGGCTMIFKLFKDAAEIAQQTRDYLIEAHQRRKKVKHARLCRHHTHRG